MRNQTLEQRYLELQELVNDPLTDPEHRPWPTIRDTAWQLIKDCQPVLDADPHAAVVALAAARIAVVPETAAGNWFRLIAIGWVMAAAVTTLDRRMTLSPQPALLAAVARDLYRRPELITYAGHRAGVPAVALLAETLTSIQLGDRSLRRSTDALHKRSLRDRGRVVRTLRAQLRNVKQPFDFNGPPEMMNAWFEQQIRSDFRLIDKDRAGARLALTGGTSVPLEAMRLTGRSLLYVAAGPHGGAAILFDAAAVDEPARPLAASVELPHLDLQTVGRTVASLHDIVAQRRTGQIPGAVLADHIEQLLAWTGDAVWVPILTKWPHLRTQPLSIVPMGETTQLPLYTALVDGKPVCVLADVTIVPSARSLVLAGEYPAADGPAFVAADPSTGDDEISCVVAEANLVADVHGVTSRILREPSTVLDHDERLRSMSRHPRNDTSSPTTLLAALRSSAILHLACHGSIQPERPLESALLLGGMVTVGSLLSEDLRSGCLIVLSACDLAGIGTDTPGEQLGFPAVLLAGGARSVVAALWPVPDTRRTARLMTQFHQALGTSPPNRALAAAIEQAREAGAPASLWAPFVCFGA